MSGERETLPDLSACRFGAVCQLHGFIHGMEAEELRERLEALETELREETADCPHTIADSSRDVGDIADMVRAILDEVDARDSLAALEARLELEGTLMKVGGEPPEVLLAFEHSVKTGRLRLKTNEEEARRLASYLYKSIRVVAQGGFLVAWAVFDGEDAGVEGATG